MDFDLGGDAQSSSGRNIAGRQARQGTSHQVEARNDALQEICHRRKLDGGRAGKRCSIVGYRAITVRQKREEVCAALQYAASFHCLEKAWHDCEELEPRTKEKLTFVGKNVEAKKHRTEWCATSSSYRCMRCGRGAVRR